MRALVRTFGVIALLGSTTLVHAHGTHDIILAMTAPAYVATGETFTYAIEITNGGLGDPAFGIVVTHKLPAEATFVGAASPKFQCSRSQATLTCAAEQIPFGITPITVTMSAPQSPARLLSSAVVDSVGTIDANPEDNTGATTTQAYDISACEAAVPRLLRPTLDESVRSPVTLQWSSSGLGTTLYSVYVAFGSLPGEHVASTEQASVTLNLAPGKVEWYVEAISDACPPSSSAASRFTAVVPVPQPKRRSVKH